jgi:predicted nuclease with TOPRIM domain
MTAKIPSSVALCAVVLLAASAFSTTTHSQDADMQGRYQMSHVESGILRLDTRTGDVSFCHAVQEMWVCKAAPEERASLDDEIMRLEDENRTLRQRVSELELSSQRREEHTLTLPSDEEFEEVLGFMERLMRRFYAFARSLGTELGEET